MIEVKVEGNKMGSESEELKIGIVGLDTSHTIEFTRRIQAPDCPQEERVEGMKVLSCLRFPSAFQSELDQDKRQRQMESWQVKVTRNLKEALEGVDAIMLEINDPSLHLEYFQKVIEIEKGKPIFLDKPLADTLENGREILHLAKEKNTRLFSASSLRFAAEIIEASQAMPEPKLASTFGPLGKAFSGSSVVWYGVHAVEMLEKLMGRSAEKVFAREDAAGVVAIIEYPEARRGVVELNSGAYSYAARSQDDKQLKIFTVDTSHLYRDILRQIYKFFKGEPAPVTLEETLEIQAILNAIDCSIQSGKEEKINQG